MITLFYAHQRSVGGNVGADPLYYYFAPILILLIELVNNLTMTRVNVCALLIF